MDRKLEFREGQGSGREVRFLSVPVEVREDDDGQVSVEGYAAVFGEETNVGGYFREMIMPGAFKRALSEKQDVPFLINHDGLPLARTSSGTLTLSEDKKGLLVRSKLDSSDPDVQRIVPKMKRGDLSKMSFAFVAKRQEWLEDDDDQPALRKVIDADLYDVSIVSTPQYEGTDIGLRALADYRNEPCAAKVAARLRMDIGIRQREADNKGVTNDA